MSSFVVLARELGSDTRKVLKSEDLYLLKQNKTCVKFEPKTSRSFSTTSTYGRRKEENGVTYMVKYRIIVMKGKIWWLDS